MISTPGLSRLDAMQKAPLGAFSLLRRPSPVASQYKRQSEMYGQALRTLSRAARRGDANAAITAIGLRDKANDEGFTPGGIGRSEDFQTNVEGREQSLMRRQADMEDANMLDRETAQTALNPNATVGAGRGRPLSRGNDMPTSSWDSDQNGIPNSIQRPTKTLSFDEQEKLARERSRASGAFGTLSRRRSPLGY